WHSLYTDSGATQWYSIDGVWDSASSQAILFAGSTYTAKAAGTLNWSVARSQDSGATWACITSDTGKIHTNMLMGDATGDIWWLSELFMADVIGGLDYVAGQVVLDPLDTTHNTLYVAGRSGAWRCDDAVSAASPTWYAAMRHLNGTGNMALGVDPNFPGRTCCTDVDWTFLYSTDGLSHMRQKTIPMGGQGEYCIAVDSTTNPSAYGPVYVGRDTALAYNTDPATQSWVNTNLSVSTGVYGCSVKKTTAGTVVLAAVGESGVWRKIGAEASGSWGTNPILSSDSCMQGLNAANQNVYFSWGAGASEMVYFTDKENGVWRSMDSGATWTLITPPTGGWTSSGGNLKYSGAVAVDPTDDQNCYVTQTNGVFFSNNANATPLPSFTKIAIPGMGVPGSAAYDGAGNIFINSLISASSKPKMFFKANGDSTWYDIVGDVFISQCPVTFQMVIGPGPDYPIYVGGKQGICVGTQSGHSRVEEFQLYN
ncbi:MAG: hypothetical protein NTW86_25275, partial [Candidatus Sumerlaeota bacterium]|nr:hypothetical protein [Candidatus Sumerlaeota bacterium]